MGKETGETAHVERWNNTALAAPGALCPHNAVVIQVVDHARILFAPLSSSLQPRAGHTAEVSHYLRLACFCITSRSYLYRRPSSLLWLLTTLNVLTSFVQPNAYSPIVGRDLMVRKRPQTLLYSICLYSNPYSNADEQQR